MQILMINKNYLLIHKWSHGHSNMLTLMKRYGEVVKKVLEAVFNAIEKYKLYNIE